VGLGCLVVAFRYDIVIKFVNRECREPTMSEMLEVIGVTPDMSREEAKEGAKAISSRLNWMNYEPYSDSNAGPGCLAWDIHVPNLDDLFKEYGRLRTREPVGDGVVVPLYYLLLDPWAHSPEALGREVQRVSNSIAAIHSGGGFYLDSELLSVGALKGEVHYCTGGYEFNSSYSDPVHDVAMDFLLGYLDSLSKVIREQIEQDRLDEWITL